MILTTTKLECQPFSLSGKQQQSDERQTTYHPQHRNPSAPHFATLIQSSCVYASHDRVHRGDSSACIETSSPMDWEPMRTARTARGREAKPSLRATRGDWSTYEC